MVRHLFAQRRAKVLDVDDLYRRHAGFVMRRISRFYSADEAEEVLHEVFLKVVERGHEFRGESHERTWLYRLATNHCLSRRRGEARRRELWQQNASAFVAAESSEAQQERRLVVEQLWRQLDEELAELAVYYFIDGLRQEDIATMLGCTRRTVVNRLGRLRKAVRDAMQEETPSAELCLSTAARSSAEGRS